MNGSRFLLRWSWRRLRQQWRQQAGVLSLITVAVALSVGAIVTGFNLAEPPEFRYGTAQVRATVSGDPREVIESLEGAGHEFGSVQRASLALPGSASLVDLRVQDPSNPVTAPLLAIDTGRWPTGPEEIAVTDGAPIGSRTIGETVSLAGRARQIVGVVENPTNFNDEFVLASDLDSFGIEPRFQSTTVLVDAAPADVTFPAGTGGISTEDREGGSSVRTSVAILVSIVTTFGLLMVAMLVGTAFAVLTRRQSRQYGLLAAAGATPRQVRDAVTLTGFLSGTVAAFVGATVGVVSAAVVAPLLEQPVAHRIDFSAPWWTVVPTVVVAVGASTVAAWWPARQLARRSVTEVLESMRPRASSTTGSTTLGVAGSVAGVALMTVGMSRLSAVLVTAGVVLSLSGLLLLAPGLIRLIGAWSKALPLAGRMAGRAIARQQGRSAAFAAAVTLALAIPVGVATISASIDRHNAAQAPNLEQNMAIAWMPGVASQTRVVPISTDSTTADSAVERLRQVAAGARVAAIEVVVDPTSPEEPMTLPGVGTVMGVGTNFGIRPADLDCGTTCDADTLGDLDENGNEILVRFHNAWVATPELLSALHIEVSAGQRSGQAISRYGDAMIKSHRNQSDEQTSEVRLVDALPANTSVAPTLIWPDTVAANDWETVTIGWLVVDDAQLSAEHLDAIATAVQPSLLVESAAPPRPQTGLRAIAIVTGAVIALGMLVVALTLLRAESAEDLQILQSIGASPRHHRMLSAMTAGILAATGAVIAIPTGYLALLVLMADRHTDYEVVAPWPSLSAVLIGVPCLAAAVGWLSSRTHTTGLGRRLS